MANGDPDVFVLDSEEVVSFHLARYIANLSHKSIQQKGIFTIALSGGTLIDTLRNLVPQKVDWSKWHVFWLDERVVARTDPESNYKLAYDGFLSKVPIPSENIYSINDVLAAKGAAEAAADEYEEQLRRAVEKKIVGLSEASGFPKFDLMLLGMGPDGHVASLFPGHPLLHENTRWVAAILDSPKLPPKRITLTLPLINSSSDIALVVTGADLASAVYIALGEPQTTASAQEPLLPVQLVSPVGHVTWFLDKDAASKL